MAGILEESRRIQRSTDWGLYTLSFLILVLVVGFTASAYRIKYAHRAVTHFEQLLSITKPYLAEPKKEDLIRSAFSQIRNKADYEQLIGELRAIAQKNEQRVPDFKVW